MAIEKPSDAHTALEVVKGTFLASSQTPPDTEKDEKKKKRKKLDSIVRNNEPVETSEREQLNAPGQSAGVSLLSDISFTVPKASYDVVSG